MRETLAVAAGIGPAIYRRPGESEDLYKIRFDDLLGIVRTSVQGFWNMGEAERYIRDLESVVGELRRRGERVRVLVDRRGSPFFSSAVAERFGRMNREVYGGHDDRIAIVVDSSLAKIQLGRLLTHVGSKAFLSLGAAETWLQSQG